MNLQELDEIDSSSESTINISTSTKTGEHRRLYQFLMALNFKISTLVGQLIHQHLILLLDSVVSDLISEETRLQSIASHNTVPIESVLAVASRSRSTLICGHCHKKEHVIDNCFALHLDKLEK